MKRVVCLLLCGAFILTGCNESANLKGKKLAASEFDPEPYAAAIELYLNDHFNADEFNTDVKFDQSIESFVLSMWIDGFGDHYVAITRAAMNDTDSNEAKNLINSWEELIEIIGGISVDVQDSVSASGEDVPVVVNFLNDDNHDEVLVTANNGNITYDIMDVSSGIKKGK